MKAESQAIVRPRILSAKKTALEDLVPLATPISAHIDICSLCNFRCSFCFQADTQGMKDVGLKRGFMQYDLFKKIVNELGEFPNKIKKIKIGNHGEPTMHPEFTSMIKYAVDSGVANIVEVFTNGSKLSNEINRGMVAGGLQRINISLEGLSDQRYLEVAGVKQDFSKIIEGVRDLYEQKQNANSDLIIYVKVADQAHPLKGEQTSPFKLSDSEKAYFLETFSGICDEIYIEKIVPQWSETQLNKQNEVGATGMYDQDIVKWKKVCPFTFMYLHFNCDGTISPCTLDWPRKVVIGNSKIENVKDVWNGKSLRELQLAMLAGKRDCVNFCDTCSAPMVCVEENLDPYLTETLSSLKATDSEKKLELNRWVGKPK